MQERLVYSVSRLNREVRQLLEQGLPGVWVEGEISNLARPASGHLYFSLKDRDAQVRCTLFRARAAQVRFALRDGVAVVARGRVSLYEARGDYQLNVESLEEAGVGALQREFERLKTKLEREGLFDAALKRPLPAVPRTIGVVTSATGAAVRDILHVLARRFAPVQVVVYPTAVQGAAAVPELLAALAAAKRRAECDVLIVARGGGSIEDLWAFNDESVARAIRAMPMPVITGVGHEIDFTIADFVADVRAPTPSAAAQVAVPDAAEWRAQLVRSEQRLGALAQRVLRAAAERLALLTRRLQLASPASRVLQGFQRLDELEHRLALAVRARLALCTHRIDVAARTLNAVSPLATFDRGFAMVTAARTGALVTTAASLAPGDRVAVRLARGRFDAEVHATHTEGRNTERGA
jgi:exodeoxyribonuclease VII large subunit